MVGAHLTAKNTQKTHNGVLCGIRIENIDCVCYIVLKRLLRFRAEIWKRLMHFRAENCVCTEHETVKLLMRGLLGLCARWLLRHVRVMK